MALSPERQFLDAALAGKHLLITFRKEWSVDAVASALALAAFLEKRGKYVDIVCDGFSAPASLGFLPRVDRIKPGFNTLQKFIISLDVAKTKIDELSYHLEGDKLHIHVSPKNGGRWEPKDVTTSTTDFKYDCIITVDSPDYASLGALFHGNSEMFYNRPTLNIDHDAGNEQFGNVNAVDITATSTSENVYALLKASGEHFLSDDIATCLLTGIISKTRSFKTANVTPRTLDAASALVAAGAKRDLIVQSLYRTRSISTLKLWGRALARLKYDASLKMAWTLLSRQDFVHAGATETHLADVIDELIMNSPDAEIVGLLYEQETSHAGGKADVCALVSTEKHADALGLLSGLKPEGSRKLARVCFPQSGLVEAERGVIAAVAKSLGRTAATVPAPRTQDIG